MTKKDPVVVEPRLYKMRKRLMKFSWAEAVTKLGKTGFLFLGARMLLAVHMINYY